MSIIRTHNRFRGVLLSTDKETGRVSGRELRTCVHCLYTWTPTPGSGRLTGFCSNCSGFLCGRPECVAAGCVHHEKWLESVERGIPVEQMPIIVRGS